MTPKQHLIKIVAFNEGHINYTRFDVFKAVEIYIVVLCNDTVQPSMCLATMRGNLHRPH